MKCKISLLVITSLIFTSVICSAGSEGSSDHIQECPDIKVVIDGKQIDLKQPTIENNGKLLVPAVAFLASLATKAHKPVTSLDLNKKIFTVNFNSKKVVFKIDSSKVIVNHSVITSEAVPLYYNKMVYIPLDLTAEVLGKTVVKETRSKTVFVRNTKDYNKVRSVLKRIKSAQTSYKKAKFHIYNGIYTINGEIDRGKRIMHFFSPFYGADQMLEMYIIENAVYFRNASKGGSIFGDNNNWGYFKIGNNMLDESYNIPINYNDSMCAGLILSEDKKKGKITLEGDMYIDEFYHRPTIYYDMLKSNDIKKAHTRLVFDNSTYFMDYGSMEITYLYYFTNKLVKDGIVYEYKDYNSNKISISLDEQSLRSAKNFDSTLVGSGFEIFEDYVENE